MSAILTMPSPAHGRFTAEPAAHVECLYCGEDSPRRDYGRCECGNVICDNCQSELEYLLGCCRKEECKVNAVMALEKRIQEAR
jgi:hypothetical protein